MPEAAHFPGRLTVPTRRRTVYVRALSGCDVRSVLLCARERDRSSVLPPSETSDRKVPSSMMSGYPQHLDAASCPFFSYLLHNVEELGHSCDRSYPYWISSGRG